VNVFAAVQFGNVCVGYSDDHQIYTACTARAIIEQRAAPAFFSSAASRSTREPSSTAHAHLFSFAVRENGRMFDSKDRGEKAMHE
jgi:hypothetical protein